MLARVHFVVLFRILLVRKGIFSDVLDLDSPGTLIAIIVVACVVFVIIIVIVAIAVVRSKQKSTTSAPGSPRRGHRVGAVHAAPGSRSATYVCEVCLLA